MGREEKQDMTGTSVSMLDGGETSIVVRSSCAFLLFGAACSDHKSLSSAAPWTRDHKKKHSHYFLPPCPTKATSKGALRAENYVVGLSPPPQSQGPKSGVVALFCWHQGGVPSGCRESGWRKRRSQPIPSAVKKTSQC